jgi:hypothetical protein
MKSKGKLRLKWKGKQVLARRNSWCDGIRKKRRKDRRDKRMEDCVEVY